MQITGKYDETKDYIILYGEDKIYRIDKNTGVWGIILLGTKACDNIGVKTIQDLEKLKQMARKIGTFSIEEQINEYDYYVAEDDDYDIQVQINKLNEFIIK